MLNYKEEANLIYVLLDSVATLKYLLTKSYNEDLNKIECEYGNAIVKFIENNLDYIWTREFIFEAYAQDLIVLRNMEHTNSKPIDLCDFKQAFNTLETLLSFAGDIELSMLIVGSESVYDIGTGSIHHMGKSKVSDLLELFSDC